MADSDDEYVQDISDDEVEAHQVTRGAGTSSRATGQGSRGAGWEVTRTWENVVEGADGTISSTVEGFLEAGKRKRLLKDTTPLQRGIIRHLIMVLDLSDAMAEKDLRPTRYLLTLRYTTAFITEFFEQNPISQLGIIGMRDGLALNISPLSGNPNDHIANIQKLRQDEPKGQPSLQNALNLAHGLLYHAPSHTTREVLILFGSLLSSDPEDIHTTISQLVSSHVTVQIIGLAAQVAICSTIVTRTNPSLPSSQTYNVALNEQHYRDLLMRATTPPATSHATAEDSAMKSSLLMMGFPSRTIDDAPTLCACHGKPSREGYLCSRCSVKVCSLPTECPCCNLTLILSTHLARSYHHLFPLRNWKEVSWTRASNSDQDNCFGCQTPFPEKPAAASAPPTRHQGNSTGGPNHDQMSLKTTRGNAGPSKISAKAQLPPANTASKDGVSESARYECENCGRFFCIDCDVFAHEVLHNCPGCQSREGELQAAMERQGGGGEMEGVIEDA
ncbi:hypothetical protein ACLMJK_002117 [Lecanora helva]